MSIARNHHIQALRGVAASLVVLDHSLEVLIDRDIISQWFRPAAYSIGGLGVITFFVISGFIMINISYDEFGSFSNSISFAKRRVMRIVPTYWIATFVAFTVYTVLPLSQHPSMLDLVRSLTFIPYSNDSGMDMHPVLGQGWTLNYEMFFYALFSIALLLPRRFALGALFIVFFGIVADGAFVKPFDDTTPATTIFAFVADPVILLFAVGMGIGIIKREYGGLCLRRPFWVAASLLLFQILCTVLFLIPPRVPFPLVVLTWIPGAMAVAACVFAVPSTHTRFERISEIMGDASYSTYLFHIFVVVGLKLVFPITAATSIVFVVLAVVSANVFGFVFFKTIERPLTIMFRGKLSSTVHSAVVRAA